MRYDTDMPDSQEAHTNTAAWENYYNPPPPPPPQKTTGGTFIHKVMRNIKPVLLSGLYFLQEKQKTRL